LPASTAAPAALDQLTPRETEVLRLVARGLSNAEIMDTLVISEDITKTHVWAGRQRRGTGAAPGPG